MTTLVLAILFTLTISGFCSLLEAFVLSVTTSEIEDFKEHYPHLGSLLEKFKRDLDETSSAILTLNTIANTMGATLVGAISGSLYEGHPMARIILGMITGGLVLSILILSEILPKNLGYLYRRQLRAVLTIPIQVVRILMKPLSMLAKLSVRLVVPAHHRAIQEDQEREILLLAEKSAKEGGLSHSERDMISNALSLDSIGVGEIMTPRTVMLALEHRQTVGEVLAEYKNIPFGRLPLYDESIDNIVGLVRRRDILQASADDRDELPLDELKTEALYTPVNASASDALQNFLKNHQQFSVVVDEFGSIVGVLTLEDIIEHILGKEIYEDSDVAVDMRELARAQALAISRRRTRTDRPV